MAENINNPDSQEAKERRRFIRTDTSIPVTLFLEGAGGKETIPSSTTNVSATGIMVEINKELPKGVEMKIDIIPPGSSNPIHCSGKVVWSSPAQKQGLFHSGIEFIDIEEDNKNTFLKFLCDTIYKVGGSK